jgi:MHS family citrate/tricarballylate:H+ symporter-like MFS transporter
MESAAGQVRGKSSLRGHHVAAATIGNALEFYDFVTYAFFSIQIGHAFFPTQSAYGSLMLSLATFGAGFVTRPIGAVVIGNYADRAGRRPAMMLCFILIGFAIVGMALIPTYAQIGISAPILAVIARMLQGFSLGGEIGSNTAFLLEASPIEKRGLVLSWQSASQNLALIAGGSVGILLTAVLTPAALNVYGWRIAFLLGAVAVPFGLWMRTNLPETLHEPEEPVAATPVLQQARLRQAYTHWRIMALGLVILASGTTASYTFTYLVTYAQATLHMSARAGFITETIGFALGIPVILFGGWLSDKHGRWPIAGLAESLPKSIRSSGFGIIYSVSMAAFGGTTQLAVTWLIHVTGSAMAPAWYLIGSATFGQIALMLMAESAPARTQRALQTAPVSSS